VPAVSPPPASVAAQPSKRDHQRDERQHDRAPTADEHSSTAKHVRPPVGRAPAQPHPHRRRAQPRGHIEGAPDRGRRARRRQTGASGGGDDNDAATHHTHPSHRSQLWCRQRRWRHGHAPNLPEQGQAGSGTTATPRWKARSGPAGPGSGEEAAGSGPGGHWRGTAGRSQSRFRAGEKRGEAGNDTIRTDFGQDAGRCRRQAGRPAAAAGGDQDWGGVGGGARSPLGRLGGQRGGKERKTTCNSVWL